MVLAGRRADADGVPFGHPGREAPDAANRQRPPEVPDKF
jgi:hypothetical protein